VRPIFALIVLITFTGIVHAQEPMPTIAQCKADRDAWMSYLQKDLKAKNLSWKELQRRAHEMSDCENVIVNAAENKGAEAETIRPSDYRSVAYWYRWALLERLENFIIRHNLSDQFVRDDEQGLR